jgi:hypothetical protein
LDTFEERIEFGFHVTVWNSAGYQQRKLLVEELSKTSEFEVSANCISAGDTGIETWLVVISATASVMEIANYLYKFFKKLAKKRSTGNNFMISPTDDENASLTEMTKDELITVIERTSFSLWGPPTKKSQTRTPKKNKRKKYIKKKRAQSR